MLVKKLQCQEEINVQGRSNRINIVEVPEKTVENILVRNYPWQVSNCHLQDCFQCSTEVNTKVSCRKPGISCTITFTNCAESGSKAVYHGESSKCGYARGGKQLEEFYSWLSIFCMVIHIHNKVNHASSRTKHFKFTILRTINGAITG